MTEYSLFSGNKLFSSIIKPASCSFSKHGVENWNNNEEDSKQLYTSIRKNLCNIVDATSSYSTRHYSHVDENNTFASIASKGKRKERKKINYRYIHGETKRDNENTHKNKTTNKCYLCMHYILPSAQDIVTLRCYEKCHTKLHYTCISNSRWPCHNIGIICPVCTKEEVLTHHPCLIENLGVDTEWRRIKNRRNKTNRSKINDNNTKKIALENIKEKPPREYEFMCKMRVLFARSGLGFEYLMNINDADIKNFLLCVKQEICESASVISKSYSAYIRPSKISSRGIDVKRASEFLMKRVRLSGLLSIGISILFVNKYIAGTKESLFVLGFCLDDIKKIEDFNNLPENACVDQVFFLSNEYRITSDVLRARFTSRHSSSMTTQMNIFQLAKLHLSSRSMQYLGITVHDMCVMNLTQDEIVLFTGYTMHQWIYDLHMTPTSIRILRIKESDFDGPNGRLFKLGWVKHTFLKMMNLSPKTIQDLNFKNTHKSSSLTTNVNKENRTCKKKYK